MKYLGLSLFMAFVMVGTLTVAYAQTEEQAAPATTADQTPPPQVPSLTSSVEKKPDSPETYDINYIYDAGNRRDPFVSLLTGIKGKKTPQGQLTVTDAKVVGITRNRDGYVAIIMGADKKARFMKPGDKLYDGAVIAIEADRVIFRQDLTEDTLSAPGLKSKEVVKRLHPVQEGT
jgi:hypothetical protein